MTEVLGSIDPHYTIAGFLVGALVGVTGVGGGSLMTPILIMLFGISPATAVGTDLLFAAATKTVGSLVHGFNRTIEWRVVRRLATGSIPATALALIVLSLLHMSSGDARHLITAVLSMALLLTAGVLIARSKISQRLAGLDDRSIARLTIVNGGLSPGAPRGSKNGNFKSGDWTTEAIEERKWLRSLLQSFAKSASVK